MRVQNIHTERINKRNRQYRKANITETIQLIALLVSGFTAYILLAII